MATVVTTKGSKRPRKVAPKPVTKYLAPVDPALQAMSKDALVTLSYTSVDNGVKVGLELLRRAQNNQIRKAKEVA